MAPAAPLGSFRLRYFLLSGLPRVQSRRFLDRTLDPLCRYLCGSLGSLYPDDRQGSKEKISFSNNAPQTGNCLRSFFIAILHFFHNLAAATGNDFSCFDIQNFVANSAIDLTVFLRPLYQIRKRGYIFHLNPKSP